MLCRGTVYADIESCTNEATSDVNLDINGATLSRTIYVNIGMH